MQGCIGWAVRGGRCRQNLADSLTPGRALLHNRALPQRLARKRLRPCTSKCNQGYTKSNTNSVESFINRAPLWLPGGMCT